MDERRLRVCAERWLGASAAAGALLLTAAQAAAYYARLDLSLGPRVILQPWLLERGLLMYEQLADLHSPLLPLLIAALRPLVPNGLLLAKLTLIALLSLTTLLAFVATWRTLGGGGRWPGCGPLPSASPGRAPSASGNCGTKVCSPRSGRCSCCCPCPRPLGPPSVAWR